MNRTQAALPANNNRIFQPKLLAVAMATVMSQSAMAALGNDPLVQINNSQRLVEVARSENSRTIRGFDIAALPNDQFAVVWAEHPYTGNGRVVLQRFNRFGEEVGASVVIYDGPIEGREPLSPAIAADGNGKVVVGWPAVNCYKYGSRDKPGEVRAYTLDEGSTTPQAIVIPDSLTDKHTCGVDVAMDEDGDFAVSWGIQQNFHDIDVQVRTYNASGQPQSSVIDVAQTALISPSLAMQADGSFMLVWSNDNDNDKENGIKPRVMGRRYSNIDGVPAGDAFRVDNFVNRDSQAQLQPSLAADPQGGYIAVWGEHSFEFRLTTSYREFDVRGQSWAADGSARSELFFGSVENAEVGATQHYDRPSVSADSDGNMLAAWSFDRSGSYDRKDSLRRATALDAQGDPLGDRDVAFGLVGEAGAVENGQGARVAVSDNAAALIWTEESTSSDSPRRLQAVFLGKPREAPSVDSSSSGGSLGWGALLMASLLAFGRRFRSFR